MYAGRNMTIMKQRFAVVHYSCIVGASCKYRFFWLTKRHFFSFLILFTISDWERGLLAIVWWDPTLPSHEVFLMSWSICPLDESSTQTRHRGRSSGWDEPRNGRTAPPEAAGAADTRLTHGSLHTWDQWTSWPTRSGSKSKQSDPVKELMCTDIPKTGAWWLRSAAEISSIFLQTTKHFFSISWPKSSCCKFFSLLVTTPLKKSNKTCDLIKMFTFTVNCDIR